MTIPIDLEWILEQTGAALAEIEDEVTGSITETTNAIVDIWEIDCQGQWIVYLKTAVVATGHALYLLLTPSLEEILESYLHPKTGRTGGRRGGRNRRTRGLNQAGASRLFFGGGIPDIDNAVADRLPGRGLFAGRRIGKAEWLFWTGIDVADRFLWYWLVLEATRTFATVWQSEILKSGKCLAIQDGNCQFTTPIQTPFNNNELWFSKDDLIGFHSTNLRVGNNGEIHTELDSQQATALFVLTAYFAVENNDPVRTGVYEVGARISVYGKYNNLLEVIEETTTITNPPGQTNSASISIGGIVKKFHRAYFEFTGDIIESALYERFDASAQNAMSTRGTEVV